MLKIFLMTRNEESMIEDWIRYHGHLVGFDNLYIVDGSDNQKVIDIYKKYSGRGLNVQHTKANLNEITEVLNETMHRHKGDDNFLIKLDTDEFLAYIDPFYCQSKTLQESLKKCFLEERMGIKYFIAKTYLSLIYGNRLLRNHNINDKLNALPRTGQKYKASFTAWAIPVDSDFVINPCSTITLFTQLQYTHQKSFFHSKSFISVDLGGHNGATTHNEGAIDTGLVTIHYANINAKDSVRRAKQALVSHGYINEDDTLEQCREKLLKFKKRGYNSSHKVAMFLKYAEATLNKMPLPSSAFNEFYPRHCNTKKTREILLVRDTLRRVK